MIENAEELRDFISKCLEEKKAQNIIVMPIENSVPIARYMIFATGRSTKNISAMAEYIALELKHKAQLAANLEGLKNSSWVLLDAGDVIVHIFDEEERERFKLEELWKSKK
jgi:ribosome-associated protein